MSLEGKIKQSLEKLGLRKNRLVDYKYSESHNESTLVADFEDDSLVDYDSMYELIYYGKEIKDKSGQSWFEVVENISDQIFLQKILKGIFPVADIIVVKDKFGNNRFLSRQMPTDLRGQSILSYKDFNPKERMDIKSVEGIILDLIFNINFQLNGPRLGAIFLLTLDPYTNHT
jgi:hypothetical protein